MPHIGTLQQQHVTLLAQCFNSPLLVTPALPSPDAPVPHSFSFMSLDSASVVLDAMKLAEDNTDGVIVRLYEAYGGRGYAKLRCARALSRLLNVISWRSRWMLPVRCAVTFIIGRFVLFAWRIFLPSVV